MKNYKSRDQIIRDIDNAHKKIAKAKSVAQEHLDQEELLQGTDNLDVLRSHREAADKQFRKIRRLETVRLPKLGQRLAIWDTLPLAIGSGPENDPAPAPPSRPQPDDALNDVTP